MVLFQNINTNQQVEVFYKGQILPGKVKFKGTINGYQGDWVGIELKRGTGEHDGMLHGRRYFQCPNKKGIFCDAKDVRFVSMRRKRFNTYKVVEDNEPCQDYLFHSENYFDERRSVPRVTRRLLDAVASDRDIVFDDEYDPYAERTTYRRPHLIGNRIPATTMLRPNTSQARLWQAPPGTRMDSVETPGAWNGDDKMISSPSIPLIHMPRSALKKQVNVGWDRTPMVRHMNVNTARDSIKFSQWNDISE